MQVASTLPKTKPIVPVRRLPQRNLLSQAWEDIQALLGAIPPSSFVLLSILSVQLGAALAKHLFVLVNPVTATALRLFFAALLLWILCRPRLHHYRWQDYGLVLLLGIFLGLGTLSFNQAIARIPLGVASSLEFVGPLGVAVLGSRKWLDLIWILLAGMGVLLLTPLSGIALDPTGIGWALMAALCWGGYISLAGKAGNIFSGGTGLTLALTVAAAILAPCGFHQGAAIALLPLVLLVSLGLALVGTVIPYSLEFAALKQVPPRIFGVLISIEPAIAALMGLLVLGEKLTVHTLLAIVLVTSGAIGVTVLGRREPS